MKQPLQTTPPQRPSATLPITSALRRVVVGLRLVCAVWMCVLAAVAIATADVPILGVLGLVVVAVGWTAFTVTAYRHARLTDGAFLFLDVVIGVLLIVWHAGVGVPGESFLGGYPFSAVVLVAAMRGMLPGLAAATALAAVSIGSAAAGGMGPQATASTVLLYGIGAATVAWSAEVIRRHDLRQRAIEEALAAERSERVRSQERAETGALLHDSVLQVLALIQRRAGDPEEVARLARSQERSLRSWLSDDRRDERGSVAKRLEAVAADVENLHGIGVDVVTVGDVTLTDATSALVAAAREALVNAARHAQVERVSLFLSADTDGATVFVRDRGAGFDPAAVGAERRGVRESIRGRMERHGGTASVKTAPGTGTEWELYLPRAHVD